MNGVQGVLVALMGGISGIIGAWALLVRAKGDAGLPQRLLSRLVDWLQTMGLWDQVPAALRSEIEAHLSEDDN